MRSDGSSPRDRSTPPAPRGTGETGARFQRLLSLAAPSLGTVGGLLALAVVAPRAGVFALLLVTAVGGILTAKVDDGRTGSPEDHGNGEATDPRSFLQRYCLGLAGFGGIGLVVTLLFLV